MNRHTRTDRTRTTAAKTAAKNRRALRALKARNREGGRA